MHVSTKDVDKDGVHIITNIIEGDGPVAMLSEKGSISARVISVQRTDSGGAKVQVAVSISEPTPAVEPTPASDNDKALAYLSSKGLSGDEGKAALERFGLSRVLAKIEEEAKATASKLDEELAALVSKA